MTHATVHQRGFTLVEIALGLVIMGLVLGAGLALLSNQLEHQKIKDTQKVLEEAKEALIGFAVVNGRLPRPATGGANGVENPVACATEAACTGLIPWTTLGVTKLDGWGKVIRYSVTPAFANANFTLATAASKNVLSRNNVGAQIPVAAPVPVVVFSHGKRNFGTTDAGAAIPNTSATNLDEVSNNTGTVGANPVGTQFFQRAPSENNAAAFGGEFDDMVSWIPPGILFNRMIQAGRLP